MALIIRVGPNRAQWWLQTLQSLLPELECRLWDEPGQLEDIEYAAVWRPPPGGLSRFPNLKAIFSIGAGVDHVLCDPELPANIPVLRTVGDELSQRMTEYVALQVLRFHRRLPEVQAHQMAASWQPLITPPAPQRNIGLMGLGVMGIAAAAALRAFGFRINGWSRTEKRIEGLICFHGQGQFSEFLAQSEILVCLLPLTPETDSILNRDTFAALPEGSYIINAGRGEHLLEQDLLQALDSGQLAGAALDVFRTEPLPADHPFWRHPKILVTPHIASLIDPLTGGKVMAQNIRRFRAGEKMAEIIDRSRGY
jgi:glyoxylate/hydroxypyruvate reductase A